MEPISRILLIDDDEEICKVLMAAFNARGMAAVCALDAITAWKMQALWPLDVAIIDAHLPGGSGLWLAREMAAQGIPTILTLAMDGPQECVPHGRVLRKPFGINQLLCTIAALTAPYGRVLRVVAENAGMATKRNAGDGAQSSPRGLVQEYCDCPWGETAQDKSI